MRVSDVQRVLTRIRDIGGYAALSGATSVASRARELFEFLNSNPLIVESAEFREFMTQVFSPGAMQSPDTFLSAVEARLGAVSIASAAIISDPHMGCMPAVGPFGDCSSSEECMAAGGGCELVTGTVDCICIKAPWWKRALVVLALALLAALILLVGWIAITAILDLLVSGAISAAIDAILAGIAGAGGAAAVNPT
jgi:hypothetical protein